MKKFFQVAAIVLIFVIGMTVLYAATSLVAQTMIDISIIKAKCT